MESPKKVFAFRLNEFETIRNLFIHYDWDFDAALIGENKTFDAARANEKSEPEEALPGHSHCETF